MIDPHDYELTKEEHEALVAISEHAIESPYYTEEELNQMCDKAELEDLTNRCLVAYWDNQRFNNSLIDAPERLYATWRVLLGWMDQVGSERALEVLREASGNLDG